MILVSVKCSPHKLASCCLGCLGNVTKRPLTQLTFMMKPKKQYLCLAFCKSQTTIILYHELHTSTLFSILPNHFHQDNSAPSTVTLHKQNNPSLAAECATS